jgi:hypothetical protein
MGGGERHGSAVLALGVLASVAVAASRPPAVADVSAPAADEQIAAALGCAGEGAHDGECGRKLTLVRWLQHASGTRRLPGDDELGVVSESLRPGDVGDTVRFLDYRAGGPTTPDLLCARLSTGKLVALCGHTLLGCRDGATCGCDCDRR